jgi:hypothetical protein
MLMRAENALTDLPLLGVSDLPPIENLLLNREVLGVWGF